MPLNAKGHKVNDTFKGHLLEHIYGEVMCESYYKRKSFKSDSKRVGCDLIGLLIRRDDQGNVAEIGEKRTVV